MRFPSAFTSINFAILLAVLAIALMFQVRNEADKLGPDVSARFLETGEKYDRKPVTTAPARGARNAVVKPVDDDVFLRNWVATNTGNANNPGAAVKYANVLVQYDIPFLLALGFFLMIATVRMASGHVIDWFKLPSRLIWIFALLPAIYIVSDLAEDLMLWRFLTDRTTISVLGVDIVKQLTQIKIWSITAAMVVAAVVALVGMVHVSISTGKR